MELRVSTRDPPTHYEILELPKNIGAGSDLSAPQLKAAYRRALLQHHPDRKLSQIGGVSQREGIIPVTATKQSYSIDQISEAYGILSVPKLRSIYDRDLILRAFPGASVGQQHNEGFRTGFETVDLDDLAYDETGELWYKSCRCGDERGFLIQEVDLDEASESGELHVGCKGCSLWLSVLFRVIGKDVHDHAVKHG